MKLKTSKVLFGAALLFFFLGAYLLSSVDEVVENTEIIPNEGTGFVFIVFIIATVFAILYARKNL